MTPEDIETFRTANAEDAEDFVVACLLKTGGRWQVCIGGTQKDGKFRHVDAELPVGLVDRALETLGNAEAQGSWEAGGGTGIYFPGREKFGSVTW